MSIGYTAFVLDVDTQRIIRATHAIAPGAAAITTLRIIDKMQAIRDDKRVVSPANIRVVGVHAQDLVKVLLIEIDGEIRRPDGSFYNIALSAPEAGLHIKVIDELANAVLTAVPESGLRNLPFLERVKAAHVFVVGVERPRAVIAAMASQVAVTGSRFLRRSQ